jgi:8-oxo-dGTP pyrophosphatase MutT (NUDIX family)
MLLDMMQGVWRRLRSRPAARDRRRRWPGSPGPSTLRVPLGAGAILRDAAGRILLIHQTYQRPPLWLPPGGWVDRGETPREAAGREVHEELGVRVAVGHPLAMRRGGFGEVTILFDCQLLDDAPFRLSHEIARAEYFSPDALPPLADVIHESLLEALATLDGALTPARAGP